ncbi:hypothetical protein [Neisseria zalophi]|uniref:hypothetical protein n=1 Tax=Neisseria zalophi TaxID=640030 RepID=UPI001243CD5F|nr:hypothetical protein [Neisseria zalophi]
MPYSVQSQYQIIRPSEIFSDGLFITFCFPCGRVCGIATHAVFIPPTNACVPAAHTLPMPITLYGFDCLRPSETQYFIFRRPNLLPFVSLAVGCVA